MKTTLNSTDNTWRWLAGTYADASSQKVYADGVLVKTEPETTSIEYTVGDEFTIFDENDIEVYKVFGKAFSWGDKLSFQDMTGKELAFIDQKLRFTRNCSAIRSSCVDNAAIMRATCLNGVLSRNSSKSMPFGTTTGTMM